MNTFTKTEVFLSGFVQNGVVWTGPKLGVLNPNLWSDILYEEIFKNFQKEVVD